MALFGLALFEKQVGQAFLLNPYIIWPFLLLKSSYQKIDDGQENRESKTDNRERREKEDFTLGCQRVLLPKKEFNF